MHKQSKARRGINEPHAPPDIDIQTAIGYTLSFGIGDWEAGDRVVGSCLLYWVTKSMAM